MYTFLVVLIIIASIILILAILAQSPKSGMAANFGASNQVMGVRQTTDFLEKFTWGASIAIVVLSFAATIAMSSHSKSQSKGDTLIEQVMSSEAAIPSTVTAPVEVPTEE